MRDFGSSWGWLRVCRNEVGRGVSSWEVVERQPRSRVVFFGGVGGVASNGGI